MDYILSLDAEEDIAILKFHGWDKKGTHRGLTAHDIGNIMCRATLMTKESTIEEMVRVAQENNGAADDDEGAFLQAVSETMDRRLARL